MTKAGYEIGRDDRGLTKREKEVLDALRTRPMLEEIGARIGVSKQRVGQIVQSLAKKGWVMVDGPGKYRFPDDTNNS